MLHSPVIFISFIIAHFTVFVNIFNHLYVKKIDTYKKAVSGKPPNTAF